jgi:hypothetical protein
MQENLVGVPYLMNGKLAFLQPCEGRIEELESLDCKYQSQTTSKVQTPSENSTTYCLHVVGHPYSVRNHG